MFCRLSLTKKHSLFCSLLCPRAAGTMPARQWMLGKASVLLHPSPTAPGEHASQPLLHLKYKKKSINPLRAGHNLWRKEEVGEAAQGLTSTLNKNVKQVIHLLARGTIFLWEKNRKKRKR